MARCTAPLSPSLPPVSSRQCSSRQRPALPTRSRTRRASYASSYRSRRAARSTARCASSRRSSSSAGASRSSSTTGPARARRSAARSVARAPRRRLHAAARVADQRDQRDALSEARVRSGRGLRADLADRSRAGRAGRHILVLPVETLADFIAYAKARPGKGQLRVVGERQRTASLHGDARIDDRNPDRARSVQGQRPGNRPICSADRCRCRFPAQRAWSVTSSAGKLRALAVTGARRSPQLPDVPTVAEAGVAGYEAYVWMGLLAPKGTPAAVVEQIHRDVVAVLESPKSAPISRMRASKIVGSTPAEFGLFFRPKASGGRRRSARPAQSPTESSLASMWAAATVIGSSRSAAFGVFIRFARADFRRPDR